MEGPVEVQCASEENREEDVVGSSLHSDDDGQASKEDELGCVVDSQVEPYPAAVVGDEVECCLIIEAPLFVLVGAGLVEGTDDAISTKGLVHVGLHGAVEGVTDSVELVVDVEVWLHNVVAEEDEHDLTQHDDNLTERAHGAHRRRKSEGCVVINQYLCGNQNFTARSC